MDLEKILAVLAALEADKVEYILVGAVALAAHGIVRATQVIDVFVLPKTDNVARLRKALYRIFPDDPTIDEITETDLAGEYPTIRYTSPDSSRHDRHHGQAWRSV